MLAIAGCGGGGGDRAGGARTAPPTVLTLANSNGDSHALEPFADAVERVSGGALKLRFSNNWRSGEPGYEAALIRDVADGKADLGWAGSRAFDDVGVRSLDALHAPLLIDSYALERAVLADPLADELLSGVGAAGVVGVGILPGPLRKPFGHSRLVRREDYAGVTVAVQRSQVADRTLRALGARAQPIAVSAPIDGYDGVEQQLASIAGNTYDRDGGVVAADVNLWPRPAVLFMSPEARRRLSERQRRWLRDGARAALGAGIALEQADQREAAATLCRRGVDFQRAGAAGLKALRAAVEPVYARLEADETTRKAIARIRTLRTATGAPPDTASCADAGGAPAEPAGPSPIDGVYRSDITRSQLQGTPGYDAGEDNPGNTGHFRMELDHGRFAITGSDDGVDQRGTFSLDDGRIAFEWNGEGSFAYRWRLYRGALVLRKTGEGPTFFAVHPWRRAGDAPAIGERTPLDGVYELTLTRDEVSRRSGEADPPSENYGRFRFVISRGRIRYTQAAEGARRWTEGTFTVTGHTFEIRVTAYGGEAPNGAAEKTGEVFAYRWSRYRDRLQLERAPGKVSPDGLTIHAWRRVGDAP